MDDKVRDGLLMLACGGLQIAAAVFICLSIFAEGNHDVKLYVALGCLVISGLYSIIRNQNK